MKIYEDAHSIRISDIADDPESVRETALQILREGLANGITAVSICGHPE